MRKRVVISVRWRKRDRLWTVRGDAPANYALKYHAAVDAGAQAVRIYRGGGLAQVRVFGKNGRIQTEWTYGADPRWSKG